MINKDSNIIPSNTEGILKLTANRVQTRINQDNNIPKINKLADNQEHFKTQQEIIHKE